MQTLILVIIIAAIVIMIINIRMYYLYIRNSKDVLSSGKLSDKIWKTAGFHLLLFFLAGYIAIAIFGKADILTAFILFGGSLFVSIMINLLFRLVNTVKERSIDVAEVLVEVIEARDPNLNGHSRYVQNLTMLFIKYIPAEMKKGISEVSLEYAALLHDVGKLGVPESVLNKTEKLNDNDWELIRHHPQKGVEILRPLKSFEHILPWIEYHHERIDGKGYYGLSGEEIPFAARIIAVCDTYSAITMRRAYKPAKTHEDAIRIMKEVAGTQLDAELVKIFCTIPKEELEKCIPEYVEVDVKT